MAGLVPAIHVLLCCTKDVDARHKAGHDELRYKTTTGFQRPKNSHNRMITGIGTPTSQSRIPFPMSASFGFLNREENAEGNIEFRQAG
jgi:hypothetical protein